MGKALVVVDVQNDFCEGGALAVAGGNEVAYRISNYINMFCDTYDLIVATRDWHDPDNDNGNHFSDTPDYVDTWPRHCVRDTFGAKFHPALPVMNCGVLVDKGMGIPAYSGFEGVESDTGMTLDEILSENEITDVDVCGLAFDYCVKATAIDSASAGYNTTVLSYLTASVSPDNDHLTEDILEAHGAHVVL